MATTTTNLGLTKPAGSEHLSLNVLNGNWDLIDAFAGLALAMVGQNKSWITNDNADNYTDTGVYFFSTGNTNVPDTYGQLIVFAGRSTDIITQIYSHGNRLYMRDYRNSAWSDWHMLTVSGSVSATVPNGTATGSYKIGTFSSLGIPSGATITSAQCSNVTSSVCHVSGFSVSGNDIYVYLVEAVSVADGQVRVTYTL